MCDRVSARIKAGFFALAWISGASGCASVSPPEGGARDLVSPKLLRTEPANGAIRVSGRTIRLFFDEDVTTTQLTEQLIVTPELGANPPLVKEEGGSFTLQFSEPFAPNTTYSLDLGETVTDITEKNKAERISLTFTTGEALDSGAVSGTVTRLLAGLPEAGAAVGLYPETDTTNPSKQRPLYRTISRADGGFDIKSVRPGTYRIFALVDANKNLLYEEPERIGYQEEAIVVVKRTTPIKLLTGRLDTRKPYISAREEGPGRVSIRYNEGLARVQIISSNQELNYRITGNGAKELEMFSPRSESENKLIVSAFDSTGNIKMDTVTVRFDGVDKNRGRLITPTVQLEAEGQGMSSVVLDFPVAIRLKPGTTSVGRIEKQLADKPVETVKTLGPENDVVFDSSRTQLRIPVGTMKVPVGGKLTLRLDSTALVPTSGQPIRIPPIPLVLAESGATGSVSGNIVTTKLHYFVQLINEAGQMVKQARDGKACQFAALAPGKYRLRVLIDENGNGRWDGPEPKFRTPAEPVFFHPDVLDVRANWEQEVKLSF